MKAKKRKSKAGMEEGGVRLLFSAFCLWSTFLMCRPQDYIAALVPLRLGFILTTLVLVVYLFSRKKLLGPAMLDEKQVKYYLALLMMMVAGVPDSLYARLSFNTIFTEYIVVVMFFAIFYKVVYDIGKLSMVLLLGCLGSGVYFIVSITSGLVTRGRYSYGNMFDPNDLAYFALVFLPLNLLFIGRENPYWVRLACIGSFGAGSSLILLSGSRGGLLAFTFALLTLLLLAKSIKSSVKCLVVMSCLALLVYAPINYDRYSTILNLKGDYNTHNEEGRLAIWGIGVRALLDNPLTGVGVRNSSYAVALDRKRRGVDIVRWQSIHNSAIQIGAETGLIGLLLFLLMSLNVVRIFLRTKSQSNQDELVRIAEMGFAGFVGMFIASLFLSQAYSVYWAFYVVFSAVVSQMLIREKAVVKGAILHD